MVKLKKWGYLSLFVALVFPAISFVPSVQKVVTDTLLIETEQPVQPVEERKLSSQELFGNYTDSVYLNTRLAEANLDPLVFKKALTGYYNLKKAGSLSDNPLITIVDFNLSGKSKRLWVIDIANNKLLYHTLVAHGQGSGDDMATSFSNTINSHQSSLGFYTTSEIYHGKHGLSMKLDGMDKGINCNAKTRAVVIHGADYVSEDFIARHGRLGRSYGCPALPVELTKEIINTIKGNTCLFINGPQEHYSSAYLDELTAATHYTTASDTLLQAGL